MRACLPAAIVAASLIVSGCNRGARQADQLDNAADQADPAAAAVMRQDADRIRANGSDANLSDAGSPVQSAMQNAGNAAAAAPTRNAVDVDAQPKSSSTQAKPHRAGDPVPPPQTNR